TGARVAPGGDSAGGPARAVGSGREGVIRIGAGALGQDFDWRAQRGGKEQLVSLRPSYAQAHNVRNLLAAVAAARALGITPEGELDVSFSALRGARLRLGRGVGLCCALQHRKP